MLNLHVLQDADGITLVNRGWAVPEARQAMARGWRATGYGSRRIDRFFVSYAPRHRCELAAAGEPGTRTVLGMSDQPALQRDRQGRETISASGRALDNLVRSGTGWRPTVKPGPDLAWRAPGHWLARDARSS